MRGADMVEAIIFGAYKGKEFLNASWWYVVGRRQNLSPFRSFLIANGISLCRA
jgi:hypothetical protein